MLIIQGFYSLCRNLRPLHTSSILFLRKGTLIDQANMKEGYVPNLDQILDTNDGYTHLPLPYHKTGGRDLETGHRINRRGGGGKRYYVIPDYKRVQYGQEPFHEKVIQIINNYPLYSANLALVAGGMMKRWIVATENMKVGDIIKSSGIIPRIPVRAIEGEAHPLGALPLGTIISSVENRPGWGASWATCAGSFCQILRHCKSPNAKDPNIQSSQTTNSVDDYVVLRLPSKLEVCVSKKCIATVGRCSNVEHKNMIVGGPMQKLYLGHRPRSGLWHRKDGTHGRKIYPTPPMRIYDALNMASQFENPIKRSEYYIEYAKQATKDKKEKATEKAIFLKRVERKRKHIAINAYERTIKDPTISKKDKIQMFMVTPKKINLDPNNQNFGVLSR